MRLRLKSHLWRLTVLGIPFVALSFLIATDARADGFCAPPVANWPAGAPTVTDGNVAADLGYNGAYRYVFDNGTADPHAAVQAVRNVTTSASSSFLYLSAEVLNASNFNADNVVVVAFDSQNTAVGAKRYRRFDIYPLGGGVPTAGGQIPTTVVYYEGTTADGSGHVNWNIVSPVPTGTTFGVAGDTDSATGIMHWQLEMQLPIINLGLSTSSTTDNGFYFDVVYPIPGSMPPTAIEYPWPLGNRISGQVDTSPLPATSSWGKLNLATNACTGIYINSWSGDITSNINSTAVAPGHLDLSRKADATGAGIDSNYFHVNVHNSGPAATGITAQFWISNFGTSYTGTAAAGGNWAPIVGITGGSTSPAGPIGAGTIASPTSQDFMVGPWKLTADQVNQYGTGNTRAMDKFHQCIMVILDKPGSDGGATFTQKSAISNMAFDVASVATSRPEISTKGLGAPPAGMTAHRFIYYVKPKLQFAFSDGSSDLLTAGQLTGQLGLFFHVFRDLGTTITIHGNQYQIAEPGPSFGYTIQHVMPIDFVQGWNTRHERIASVVAAAQGQNGTGGATGNLPGFGGQPGTTTGTTVLKSTAGGVAAQGAALAATLPANTTSFYRTINAQLAQDTEKPNRSDWSWQISAFKPVGDTSGLWYTVEVPPESTLPLDVTVNGYQTSPPGQPGCMCTPQTNTPASAGLTTAFLAIGAVIYRRRRRG